MNNKPMSTEYLDRTMFPLMHAIEPKPVQSLIDKVLKWKPENSKPSIQIQFGNNIETFWNIVLDDCPSAKNLIAENNMIMVGKDERQLDHLFEIQNTQHYLESKCNLNFDSEKVKASNAKIAAVTERLGDVKSAYFCPVADEVPHHWKVKYNNKGMNIIAVNDMIKLLGDECPFTADEYFTYLGDVIGPMLDEKRYDA